MFSNIVLYNVPYMSCTCPVRNTFFKDKKGHFFVCLPINNWVLYKDNTWVKNHCLSLNKNQKIDNIWVFVLYVLYKMYMSCTWKNLSCTSCTCPVRNNFSHANFKRKFNLFISNFFWCESLSTFSFWLFSSKKL